MLDPAPTPKDLTRFWAKVDKTSTPDGCWTWTGRRTDSGYGQWWYQGKVWRATRFIYEATVGEIPEGHVILHKCDNPPCVRPDHLEAGTQQENAHDMEAKGRSVNQKQHVDIFRKQLLRKQLLRSALPGPAFVPFCGDGDLAQSHYSDRVMYAADLDPERIATFQGRFPGSVARAADCDVWPFADLAQELAAGEPFAVADFDAYAYPYASFRGFWENAPKATRLVMFFTDAQRQAIFRTGYFRLPDGTKMHVTGQRDKGHYGNFWLKRHVEPWAREALAPYKIKTLRGYLRGMMLYWGVVCEL